jgi:hypothetical protein
LKNAVYRFLNKEGNILYIGKATVLEDRMKNHEHLDEKCYNAIDKIEYIELDNSDEMSIYERYLINIYSPKYNISYNNSSTFCFELPKKTWKNYPGKVLKKELKSNERRLSGLIKKHRENKDYIIRSNKKWLVISKEKGDERKKRFEEIHNNMFILKDSEENKIFLINIIQNSETISIVDYENVFEELMVFGGRVCYKDEELKLFPESFVALYLNGEYLTIVMNSKNDLKLSNTIVLSNNYEKEIRSKFIPIEVEVDHRDIVFNTSNFFYEDKMFRFVINETQTQFKKYIN